MIKEFFDARRIAVIGAAREREKVGNVIFRNLIQNKNLKVFPINPNADKIEGVKALPDVLSVPYPVDLAVIAVPAPIIPEVLEQCGKKQIKNVMIISAGFEEAGNKELTEELKVLVNRHKFNLLGPNVMGFINTYKEINASFFSGKLEKGKIAFVSQSGALGSAVLDKAIEEKLGISSFISMGNMMHNDFNSALEYLKNDIYTEIIMVYIESLKEDSGKRFIELCKEISKKKRIIVLKSGKSEKGLEASKTHTASLSSDSKIYSGAFKQAGVSEVSSLSEMFRLAKIYSRYPKLGKRAVIISNAGGLGVLAVDSLENVELPEIPEKILKELDSFIPRGYSRRNPLDILGEALAERYERVIKILDKENWFDYFVVLVSPQAMTQGKETAKILEKTRKPVFACFIGGESFKDARKVLKENQTIGFDDVSELSILGKI